MRLLRALAAAALVASAGCASTDEPFRAYLEAPSEHVRSGEQVLRQIVYTIWFPERPARADFDLLAGRLDGIVWRVTLAPDGEPLIYDSIHPCGYYHKFFPAPRARARPAPDALEEWAFVPQRLPRIAEGERPLLRLASGTHYIEGVSLVRGLDSLTRCEMRPTTSCARCRAPTVRAQALSGRTA